MRIEVLPRKNKKKKNLSINFKANVHSIAPNVKFIVDDFEDEWVYGNVKFDFIHARYLAVSVKDFPRLLRQCYRLVKCPYHNHLSNPYRYTSPGGWVEFQDWDGNLFSEDGSIDGTSMKQYFDAILPAMQKTGRDPSPGPKLETWFHEAGFEDVHVQKFLIPTGMWPKDKRLVCILFRPRPRFIN